jgi:hypothetical protein
MITNPIYLWSLRGFWKVEAELKAQETLKITLEDQSGFILKMTRNLGWL